MLPRLLSASSAPYLPGGWLCPETRSCFAFCSSALADSAVSGETQGQESASDSGCSGGSLTPGVLSTHCKENEEQSPGTRNFGLRWMKPVEPDGFGGGVGHGSNLGIGSWCLVGPLVGLSWGAP